MDENRFYKRKFNGIIFWYNTVAQSFDPNLNDNLYLIDNRRIGPNQSIAHKFSNAVWNKGKLQRQERK